jgi:N-acetylmuramoyl-L-alanine amidase
MRIKGTSVQQLVLTLALLAAVAWNLAHAGELKGIRVDSGATGTRAELQLDAQARYELLTLSGPDRLVVDLPGTVLAGNLQLPAAAGVVQRVRSGHPVAGTTRIVFDLADDVAVLRPRLEPGPGGPVLVLEWPGDGANVAVSQASASATSRLIASLPTPSTTPAQPPVQRAVVRQAPVQQAPIHQSPDPLAILTQGANRGGTSLPPPAPVVAAVQPAAVAAPPASRPSTAQAPVKTVDDIARRAGMRPLIIAIDAGHGGQDPGARGPSGTREKDVTLQIARRLAQQVNATPGLKAYLTRDTDTFIPLTRRYQLAREHKADLFVSIHADAFSKPSASGSSVFVLSQRGASSQAAKWLATQENAADLVGGVKLQDKEDVLASVLLDLSQSATMKASEEMAAAVLDGLKDIGKTHKTHVERANFVVLRSPDVPSMLVETAFISNPDEERKLRDPDYQGRLANAIVDGVTSYFSRQPPPGTLYAARAEATRGATGGSP